MNRIGFLFALSILSVCLLAPFTEAQRSNLNRQQTPPPRVNYYYYEMDAGPLNVIQITLKVQANVFLVDKDNFQRYKDGQAFTYAFGIWALRDPIHIVPPKEQHWYVVIDAKGNKFTPNAVVRLFSESKEIPQKQ